ncbi:MAG: formimidoylglutamase [Saprospiraceae bacterium]
MSYQPTDKSVWQGRTAPPGSYWYQRVHCRDMSSKKKLAEAPGIALLGYAIDEGIRRNQGRLGAAAGPAALRKRLATLADHLAPDYEVLDAGDVLCPDGDLEASQRETAALVTRLLDSGRTTILMGGGHDAAYAHYLGIRGHLKKGERLGILNIDAHFDLRPLENGLGHSGSPFTQIQADEEALGLPFLYICLGIQQTANTRQLYERAAVFNVVHRSPDEFLLDDWYDTHDILDTFCARCDKLYLTIDLDGFSSAFAPGVSAPSPWGLEPEGGRKIVKKLIKSHKLIALDVVELNPAFDRDESTARLAAGLIEQAAHRLQDL